MAVLGADPVQLRDVAREMRRSRQRIEDARKHLGSRVVDSDWSGRDAHQFRALWRGHESQLESTATLLTDAASELERNALEQESASDAEGGSGAGSRALAATQPRADTGLAGGMPAGSETYWLNAEFAALLGIDGEGRVTIDHLADGSAIVWLESEVGASVEGGTGAQFGAADVGVGAMSSAEARGAETHRMGWHMNGEDVDEFVPRALATHAVMRATGDAFIPNHATLGGLPGVGRLVPDSMKDVNLELSVNPIGKYLSDRFSSTGLSVGPADHHEHSVELGVAGEGDLDAGRALAGGSLGAAVAAGVRSGPEGRSLFVRGSGNGAVNVPGWRGSGSTTREAELSLDGKGPAELTVTTITRVEDRERVEVQVHSIPAAQRDSLVDAAINGDVVTAGSELADIAGSLDQPIESAAVEGVVERDAIDDIGGEIGEGAKGELRVGGGREVVDYRSVPNAPPLGTRAGGGA